MPNLNIVSINSWDWLNLNSNSSINYYIEAININEKSLSHPNAGWHTFNTLDFILGDVNEDNIINIQDIVIVVNLILSNEYNFLADLNDDQSLDILDIVQMINIILN